MIQPLHKSAPKTSPPVVESVSCSSGGPSPVTTAVPLAQTPNSNSSSIPPTPPSSNGVIAITPKIEHSPPPPSGHHYEPHRQTVLMWGAANQSSRVSPSSTPTANGLYDTSQKSMEETATLKWNGKESAALHVYPSLHHQAPSHEEAMYALGGGGAGSAGGHLHSGEHHQNTASQSQNHLGNSCEVWTPSYSQYQYFYHHPPQHTSTQ